MLPSTLVIFDDTVILSREPLALHRYAMIRTTPYQNGYIFRCLPLPDEAPIVETQDTSTLGCHSIMVYPNAEMRRTLMWNTGWSMELDGELVPVVDLEARDLNTSITFTLKAGNDTMFNCRARQAAQRELRLTSMRIGVSHFMQHGVLPLKIPTFVANLMKDELIRKEEACPITSVKFQKDIPIAITACFHSFDPEALESWLKLKRECPTCRAAVLNTTII
jgi:hypothetical protein